MATQEPFDWSIYGDAIKAKAGVGMQGFKQAAGSWGGIGAWYKNLPKKLQVGLPLLLMLLGPSVLKKAMTGGVEETIAGHQQLSHLQQMRGMLSSGGGDVYTQAIMGQNQADEQMARQALLQFLMQRQMPQTTPGEILIR